MSRPLRIGMIAGEMSGDMLGAELMAAMRRLYSGDIVFEGIGGARMIASGFTSYVELEQLSVMGLVEVFKRLPQLLSIRKKIHQHFVNNKPDVLVGIDSPDFNLPLEFKFKRTGIKTVHYVSPSVWAWRQRRVHKIAKSVDLMLALLPFEVDFYKKYRVPVKFVGHPLADNLPVEVDQQKAREKFSYSSDDVVVALLPGSRSSEVELLAHDFFGAARWLRQRRPRIHFVVPAANRSRWLQLQKFIEQFPELDVRLVEGQSHDAMAAADVVLMASGTTTLEAMLLKRPMVVAYRFSTLTYAVFSRMVRTPYVALPNIIAAEPLVPEILQKAVTPDALGKAVLRYLEEPAAVAELQQKFLLIHQRLQRNASDQAASAILDLIGVRS